jgi:hAT family C-terminal dimerisation region
MLTRTCYLHRAFDHLVTTDAKIAHLKILPGEWIQIQTLLSILLPFRSTSDTLEQTSRPAIDKVFWAYETLFNKIDSLMSTVKRMQRRKEAWADPLLIAIEAMRDKLTKYYSRTSKPFVYSDASILNPFTKTEIFQLPSFDDPAKNWLEYYTTLCKTRFEKDYQHIADNSELQDTEFNGGIKRKRPTDEQFFEEEDYNQCDAYTQFIMNVGRNHGSKTELDRYLEEGTAIDPQRALAQDSCGWWRENAKKYPALAKMFRDTMAVPATGAGVERQFSQSGRVATRRRPNLSDAALEEAMLVKSYLAYAQSAAVNDVEGETQDDASADIDPMEFDGANVDGLEQGYVVHHIWKEITDEVY